jgi:hypothetical protein
VRATSASELIVELYRSLFPNFCGTMYNAHQHELLKKGCGHGHCLLTFASVIRAGSYCWLKDV